MGVLPTERSGSTGLDPELIRQARIAGEGVVKRTPMVSSTTIGDRVGGRVVLKAESLQSTGSFKIRARCPSCAISARRRRRASWREVRATTPRPSPSPLATSACPARSSSPRARRSPRPRPPAPTARRCARPARRWMPRWPPPAPGPTRRAWPSSTPSTTWPSSPVRPRWGSSWSRTCPTSAASSCRSAEGGLASGVAIAVKQADPTVSVVGVQVDVCAPYANQSVAGGPITTLADGIAVKSARPAHQTARRRVGGRHRDGRRGRGGRRHDVPDGEGQALRRGRWRGRGRRADGRAGGTGSYRA